MTYTVSDGTLNSTHSLTVLYTDDHKCVHVHCTTSCNISSTASSFSKWKADVGCSHETSWLGH